MSNIIVWLRRDLRLQDNPALYYALATGHTVIPVYIYAPDEEAPWQPGSASRWWLHHSLQALDTALRAKQSALLFYKGRSLRILQALIKATQAKAVHWNSLYEPSLLKRDRFIKAALHKSGITVRRFKGALLHEPWTIKNQAGKPYQLFIPFWQACQRFPLERLPLAVPDTFKAPIKWPKSLNLNDLNILAHQNSHPEFANIWQPGEAAAWQRLHKWCRGALSDYAKQRDFPYLNGVSRLSPSLHFGELSPRQVLGAAKYALYHLHGHTKGIESYERQLYWREFAYYLLYHYPKMTEQPLDTQFQKFPWRNNSQELLTAWQQGQTGYPLIDAGMRELRATGWMHNRVRMVVASFLTKNCGIPWQEGARWFWDSLVDADLANNTLGWQWVTGCGPDAAPSHRIFNPLLQSSRYDPQGQYLRRWLPEIAHLPIPERHKPWAATPKPNYPAPIIEMSNEITTDFWNKRICSRPVCSRRFIASFSGL